MKRRRTSHTWSKHLGARRISPHELSEPAARGLECACDLAWNAEQRAAQVIRQPRDAMLTIARLAAEEGVSEQTVKRRIAAGAENFSAA
jgi:hypothetical protein